MESEANPMSKHSSLQNPVSQNPVSSPSGAVEIQTARLDLVPVTPESLRCQVGFGPRMYADLGAAIHAQIPAEWPPENWEPHVLDYLLNLIAEDPEATGWCRYLLLRHPGGRTLIGTFGCAFPKADTGQAELGYGLLPSWQRQGFAAEAVLAMLPWLQSQRTIRAFVAQTFPDLRGSIRVLEKCGFQHIGPGFEEGTVLYRRELSEAGSASSG
jgi:ribosomal-protein-alanine N-acetyltransferase